MRIIKKLNEEKLLFYDIETAPLVRELEIDTPLFQSWNYKCNKKGELSNKEVIDLYSKDSGLYAEFAKVISIVIGKIKKGKIILFTIDDEKEKTLLNKFNGVVDRNSRDKLAGFVNISFDTPFVFKRMLINGILPHNSLDSSGLKPWEVDELDIADYWKGSGFNRASLISIATAFCLPSPKDDITGADVGRVYWEDILGRKGLDRISAYCRRDVVTTINIFKKMRLEEPLEVGVGEFGEQPLVMNLFGGGKYGVKEKKELKGILSSLDKDSREEAYIILGSLTSSAKGKRTKLTKAHITTLKKELK